MEIKMQDVGNLFTRYGWNYDKLDDQMLLTGFRGKSREFFEMGARLDNNWLTLSIPDYLPALPDERHEEIYRYLLELNSRVYFVRFALDSEDKVIVMTSIPLGNKKIDFDLFKMAIEMLSYYADDAYSHLYKIITGEEPPKPKRG